jgi:hypothetical protein
MFAARAHPGSGLTPEREFVPRWGQTNVRVPGGARPRPDPRPEPERRFVPAGDKRKFASEWGQAQAWPDPQQMFVPAGDKRMFALRMEPHHRCSRPGRKSHSRRRPPTVTAAMQVRPAQWLTPPSPPRARCRYCTRRTGLRGGPHVGTDIFLDYAHSGAAANAGLFNR